MVDCLFDESTETSEPAVESAAEPEPRREWYSTANLARLWNGIRTGKAPGMVCHSTDPNAPEYGGKPGAKDGGEKPCGGAIALVAMESHALNQSKTFKDYSASREKPLTKRAFLHWMEMMIFSTSMPMSVESPPGEIGFPWQQAKE